MSLFGWRPSLGSRSRLGRRAAATGPRIAVIGNCQAAVMARAMRLMRPDATVAFVSAGTLGRRPVGTLSEKLARHDHVFAQPLTPRQPGHAHLAALGERHPGYATVPNVVFAAFHPDLVYVGGPGTAAPGFVESPVGHYNSALVLYAYLAGLRPEQAERLFDGALHEALGYLDLWDYAAETLLDLGRAAGLDLAEPLLRWTRRGLFMHSTNHPRAFVLADLAATMLTRAGLPADAAGAESYLPDDLAAQGMWPVYGPVARRYGVPESELFMAQRLGRGRAGPPRVFRLGAFIAGSYARYAAVPRSHLHSDRVQTWLASDDMRRLFADQAGR